MTKEEALVEMAAEIMMPFSFFAVMHVSSPDKFSASYNYYLKEVNEARRLARKLVEAGWRPTIGLDNPDET
jgi:hypothetical protein